MTGRILCPALLLAGSSSANFASTVEFVGFSSDAAYFAWEQYGVQDGSGFPFSETVVQETDGGAIAWRWEVVLEDESDELSTARGICRSQARSILESLSPDGWSTGVLCIHHPPTDLGVEGDSVRFHSAVPAPGYALGDWTVRVEQTAVENSEMEAFWGLIPVLLTVVARDNPACDERILIRDEELAPERSYSCGYGIESVWAMGDSAFAVSIGVTSLGFEGTDLSYMFTGWRR